jgi:plastocyanin domain-containing protein
MDKIISLVVSIAAAGFIGWWFFGKRQETAIVAAVVDGTQTVEITVNGGYQPRVVQLKAGMPAKLIFDRQDPSSCLEEVQLPDFGVSQTLPVGQKTEINIGPQQPGQYKYTCGMQMFSGQVVIK